MVDISTIFAGLRLRSPIIAASAPPTESVSAITKCVKAGIGAIVTKSAVDYRRDRVPNIPRRTLRHPNGQWSIQGSFASETLTLGEAINLHHSLRGNIDVPIITSVGYVGGSSQQTVDTCARLVESGSSMLHLDLFYTPQPRASDAELDALRRLIQDIRQSCGAPVSIKLNIDYPAHLMATFLEQTELDAVFLLDSIRTPIPHDDGSVGAIPHLSGAVECSLFGNWQRPLTLQYTSVIARATRKPICAGGGLQNAADALQVMALGAAAVQFATQIMVHGAQWIRRTNDEIALQLHQRGYQSLSHFRAKALMNNASMGIEVAAPVYAKVDHTLCTGCDVCTRLMFCSNINRQDGSLPVIHDDCTGCGFCVALCPTRPKAIQLIQRASN